MLSFNNSHKFTNKFNGTEDEVELILCRNGKFVHHDDMSKQSHKTWIRVKQKVQQLEKTRVLVGNF